MSIWDKPVFSSKDCLAVMPGQGRAVLDLLIQAGWLAPSAPPPARPFYDSAHVRACLERLKTETPRPIHRWMLALGGESSHLVSPKGKTPCGARATDWLTSADHTRKCTRCQGHAKILNVSL